MSDWTTGLLTYAKDLRVPMAVAATSATTRKARGSGLFIKRE
jgi:hypothetical protein